MGVTPLKRRTTMVIEHEARLNNFCGAIVAPLQTQKDLVSRDKRRFYISTEGVIQEIGLCCPKCASRRILENGTQLNKNKLFKKLKLKISFQKYACKNCNHTWTLQFSNIRNIIRAYKLLVEQTVFYWCANGATLEPITKYIIDVFGCTISKEWVRQLYIKSAGEIEKKLILETSGIFNYDEQVVHINGVEGFRVVVIDAVSKDCIFDEWVENKKIETLKDKLRMKMLPYKKTAFVVDLARGYPAMLKEIFPNAKVQWCIFHLNKHIVEDFEDYEEYACNKHKMLPLLQLYNMYLMLNIFFDHDAEVQNLKQKLKRLQEHKEILPKGHKLDETAIGSYELSLIKDFVEFRKGLKKHRRKYAYEYLLRKDKDE
ncbi:MAG: hypothetical protein AAB221_14300, partial [Bacteroidota bacterium]